MEASGFINAQGNAEYVVSMENYGDIDAEKAFLLAQEGVKSVKATEFKHWYMIELSGLAKLSIDRIRSLEQVGFAYPNRGIWLCH